MAKISKSSASKPARHRSAKSGKFVTKKFAESHPATTVKEALKPKGRGTGGGAHIASKKK